MTADESDLRAELEALRATRREGLAGDDSPAATTRSVGEIWGEVPDDETPENSLSLDDFDASDSEAGEDPLGDLVACDIEDPDVWPTTRCDPCGAECPVGSDDGEYHRGGCPHGDAGGEHGTDDESGNGDN